MGQNSSISGRIGLETLVLILNPNMNACFWLNLKDRFSKTAPKYYLTLTIKKKMQSLYVELHYYFGIYKENQKCSEVNLINSIGSIGSVCDSKNLILKWEISLTIRFYHVLWIYYKGGSLLFTVEGIDEQCWRVETGRLQMRSLYLLWYFN